MKIIETSFYVKVSGTKDPDAITFILYPTISESVRLTMVSGNATIAIFPPLHDNMCFLAALISSILAPKARRLRVMACFSVSVILPGRLKEKRLPTAGYEREDHIHFIKTPSSKLSYSFLL
ncbi:MAG: hypothetical protein SWO11_10210 [Thermodesulfobacteriota bacterium]|nr:hypothetical protein [Thermodesulfobacteriota bacterium]